MANVRGAERTTVLLRRIARVWSLLPIGATLLVAGGYGWNLLVTGQADPYAVGDYAPIENLPLLFSLLSALGLAAAWRWEGWGGAIAVGFQLATLPVLLIHWPLAQHLPNYLIAPYGVWLVFTIPGLLFLASRRRSHRP